MTTLGIVGGSGLYALDGLQNIVEKEIDTPFGKPSDALICGELDGVSLAFLPRHGRGHRLTPSEIPYRANIWALKSLGVQNVLSVSAVGSMHPEVKPGHFAIPDQYIDRTKKRVDTFFGDGIVGHVGLGEPTCSPLRHALEAAIQEVGIPCHHGGTYVCIEGPAFSTRAESLTFQGWGAKVIGMTAMPEARLAREAELHYCTVALVTDFDCWHEEEESVNVEAVLAILKQNTANIKKVITTAVKGMSALEQSQCGCDSAMQYGVVTAPEAISDEAKERLSLIVGKYL